MDVPTHLFTPDAHTSLTETTRELGHKQYEISNHLGNVLSVITDQKLPVVVDSLIVSYSAVVVTATDYSTFGVGLYGRSWSGEYRYGFNGKEVDSEGMGGGSSTYDYGFRIYNAQLGKFLSVDPLFKSFPYYSPYQFASNTPIAASDIDGLESTSDFNEVEIREEIDHLIGDYKAIKSGTEQVIHILDETESYLNGLYALKMATYVPTAKLAYLLLSVVGEISIDEEIAKAEADIEMYERDVEWRLSAADRVISDIRQNAVRIAKAREVKNVLEGGSGITREFSPEELEYIRTHKKLPPNLHGDHVKSVKDHPELAGDPNNIKILDGGGPGGPRRGSEHHEKHRLEREAEKMKTKQEKPKSANGKERR